jgi:hypothetical protein
LNVQRVPDDPGKVPVESERQAVAIGVPLKAREIALLGANPTPLKPTTDPGTSLRGRMEIALAIENGIEAVFAPSDTVRLYCPRGNSGTTSWQLDPPENVKEPLLSVVHDDADVDPFSVTETGESASNPVPLSWRNWSGD